jgi:hypothetical protein
MKSSGLAEHIINPAALDDAVARRRLRFDNCERGMVRPGFLSGHKVLVGFGVGFFIFICLAVSFGLVFYFKMQ